MPLTLLLPPSFDTTTTTIAIIHYHYLLSLPLLTTTTTAAAHQYRPLLPLLLLPLPTITHHYHHYCTLLYTIVTSCYPTYCIPPLSYYLPRPIAHLPWITVPPSLTLPQIEDSPTPGHQLSNAPNYHADDNPNNSNGNGVATNGNTVAKSSPRTSALIFKVGDDVR